MKNRGISGHLALAVLVLACVLSVFSLALAADSLPLEGPAPFLPVLSALSEDGMNYDDGTLSVRIEKGEAYGSVVYYVYVNITHPSQLRTALAADWPSQHRTRAVKIARKSNAVFAINADFFAFHTDGIIFREGKQLRWRPRLGRDVMFFDYDANLHMIAYDPTAIKQADYAKAIAEDLKPYEGNIRDSFSFGPALIMDGVIQEYDYHDKTSCGYPEKRQRIAFCQLAPLSYLIVACEGPEQESKIGLTIPEFVDVLVQLGVQNAYNLDGGSSTALIMCGNKVNASPKDRDLGDIIYFATLREDGTAPQ